MVNFEFVYLNFRAARNSGRDSSRYQHLRRRTTIELADCQHADCQHVEEMARVRAATVCDLETNLAAQLADRRSDFGANDSRTLLLGAFFSVLSVLALGSASSLLLPIVQSGLSNAETDCPARPVYSRSIPFGPPPRG